MRPVFKIVFYKPDGNPGWNVKVPNSDFETCEKFQWCKNTPSLISEFASSLILSALKRKP